MKIQRFRTFNQRHQMRRRPINVLVSVMTLTNLCCGTASIFASIGLEFEKAAYLIVAALLLDMFDGTVARLTKNTSEFGKELDSLCDIVSFGVAPSALIFTSYLPDATHLAVSLKTESIVGTTGSFVAIVYVICAALRLARFNTYQAERYDTFVGLPSPAAAGTIAAFVLFIRFFEGGIETRHLGPVAYYALGPLAVLLALLMVSTVHYPKSRVKAFVLAPRHAFFALGTYAFIAAFFFFAFTKSPSMVLFPLGCSYVLFGMGANLYRRYIHRAPVTTASPADVETFHEPVSTEVGPSKSDDRL